MKTEKVIKIIWKIALPIYFLGSRTCGIYTKTSDYDIATTEKKDYKKVLRALSEKGIGYIKTENFTNGIHIFAHPVPIDFFLMEPHILRRHQSLIAFIKTLDPKIVSKQLLLDIINQCQVNDD